MVNSFEKLMAQLKQENIPFKPLHIQKILSIPSRVGEQTTILHIRWQTEPGIVHFVQPLPLTVPRSALGALAIFLHDINHKLAVPGFTLDVRTGRIAFRTQAFLDAGGSIAAGMIGALIATCTHTAARYLPALHAALEQR
jgi:hypothetical protein